MCQKQCIRILFGNKEAYLDKFKTCARARPFGFQKLDSTFFQLEHTKPLFKANNILSVQNLYTYHCFMEIFKILKFRQPMSLFEKYVLSRRKATTLISTFPTRDFTYRSTVIWNSISPKIRVPDFSSNIGMVKNCLKKVLFTNQHKENPIDWTTDDYNINKIPFSKNLNFSITT